MSDLRQAYAATALAGLGWEENVEKAIDRVAAAGKASTLGINLWRAKYQLEAKSYENATKEIMAMFRKRYNDNDIVSSAVVDQALREYFVPACRACQGRGEAMVDERKVICETCGGTKVHNFSNEERCRTMRLSSALTKRCAFKISWLLGVLCDEDAQVNYELNIQLERIILDNQQIVE